MVERRLDDDEEWEWRRLDRGQVRHRRDPLTERIREIQGKGRHRPLPPHGTYRRYQRGCHCDECRSANARYERERKARKLRQTWQQTWGALSIVMAKRSRCARAQIGAVIVSPEQRVVATGYNGPPSRWKHAEPPDSLCTVWCPRGQKGPEDLPAEQLYDDCPAAHAEINALMHSERKDRENGIIYVTGSVCMTCAKAIANSGIAFVALVNVDEEADAHRHPEKVRQFLTDSGIGVWDVVVPVD